MKKIHKSLTLAVSALTFYSANITLVHATTTNVHAITVTQQSHQLNVSHKGRIEAQEDVALQAQVVGYLQSKHFSAGDFVSKGDLLFQLDDSQYQAKLLLAQALLSESNAKFDIAKLDYLRSLKLLSERSISQATVDQLLATKVSAAAVIKGAQANVLLAKTKLSYTRISAPFSGKISDSQVAIGQLISSSTPMLASLVRLSPIYASFQLSESDFYQAKQKHQEQKITLPSVSLSFNNGESFTEQGEITYWGNRIDKSTGTIAIKAIFSNHDKSLLPGQYVEVMLTDKHHKHVFSVPHRALQRDIVGNYVMLIDKANKAVRQNVTTGQNYGSNIIITSGIKADDRVITQGIQKVKTGTAVSVTQVEL